MPKRNAIYSPCTNQRDPLDIAGRINDLINCYLIHIQNFVNEKGPLILIGIVLLVIMFLAARELIKD